MRQQKDVCAGADCAVMHPICNQVSILVQVAGVEGRPVAFLLCDIHIVHESFLEDVNSILNSGEVTGMFTSDEREKVLDSIRPWLGQQAGLGEGHEAAWSAFIRRARDNLHMVLVMSPMGDAFRIR